MTLSPITRLEKHVVDLEEKEKLTQKDLLAIMGFIKRLENLDADFKEYHSNVIDLSRGRMSADGRKGQIRWPRRYGLLELGVEEGKDPIPSVVATSKPLEKQLSSLTKEQRSINVKIDSLFPGSDFDLCPAQHLAKCISELKSEHVHVTSGVPLLESDHTKLSEWDDNQGVSAWSEPETKAAVD